MKTTNGLLTKFSFFLIQLVFAATCVCSQATKSNEVFEMIMFGSRPGVKVFVNGKGPFNFLIDTGADGFGRIDSATAANIGLKPSSKIVDGDNSGKTRQVDQIKIDSLRLGNIQFKNLVFKSRNYNPFKGATGYHIDGILALGLFKDYLLSLNYLKKNIEVKKGSLKLNDGNTILSYTTPDNTPQIQFSIGPLLLSGDIDTGDSEGISLPEWLAKLLPSVTNPKIVGTGKSLNNTYSIYETKISVPVKLANYTFFDPTIVYTSVFDNCNLGSSWLNNFNITFDQKKKLLKFEK